MKTLLQINSSLAGEHAASTALADRLVAGLLARTPGLAVVRRNLGAEPLPHLDAARLAALGKPAAERTAAEAAIAAEADAVIAEVQAAGQIVIAAPMYNFSAPSTLKSWFDHLARAGTTFRYTAHGPEGLLTGKRATLVTTRGGVHRDRPQDHLVPYVRTMLAFVGVTDLEVVYAEGLALGAAPRDAALEGARVEIDSLAARRAA
ncbi:MAG TPA: NAD(P)H-dependent oxidoreductase [Steroidobacteraceae bacterium]|nr:NAD(P)H-dependent oxidoreductase [Steroidobacteraceae bacterium]